MTDRGAGTLACRVETRLDPPYVLTANFGAPRRATNNQTPAARVASEIHCVKDSPACNPCS